MTALRNVNRKETAQTTRARADQVVNNAGGYVFAVDDKARLERFLILGTDGGTYYVGEKNLTEDAVNFVSKLIKNNERLVRETVVSVSDEGRAYRNSPALFTLALLFVEGSDKDASRAVFDKVVRTSTHLFEFAQYIENLGGWGRSKRGAVAEWYENKEVDKLAYQLVKYRSRNGWTHRDLLRLSHPKRLDSATAAFALREVLDSAPALLKGYHKIATAQTVEDVVSVLTEYTNLPWETIPTHLLNDPEVWKALFHNGQLRGQNAIRNVGRLNKINAFDDMVFAREFANVIADEDNIKASRLHPINYLNAITANRQPGYYEVMETALPGIVHDALNDGFHASFKYVKPANKRTLLGLDVSASMTWGNAIGLSATPAEAGAAMAMTIARTEPYYAVMGFSRRFVDLGISPGMALDAVMKKTSNVAFGGTDCSLPMEWALKNKVEVDHFCVITDNETWAGHSHPHQALKSYRDSTGIDAKVSVIGMTATEMTIADGSPNMLDVVGFDTNAPRVLTDFSAGRI